MISHIQNMLPEGLRPIVVPAYRRVRRSLNRIDRAIDRRTLDEKGLRELLRLVGFKPGAVVMVHSSMDEITRRVPNSSPMGLIHLMMEMVGPGGTILMPTFPFRGKQLHYVEANNSFDRRRTPSQVGLITEVFRRMPGVVRSLHPTHPLAAWGSLAEELTSTHHLGGTFDQHSPIYKLGRYQGIVVGLATGLRDSFTILHVPEEIHPIARERFFETQTRSMSVVDGTGRFDYSFRVLRADVQRNYDRVEKELLKDGVLRRLSAGGLHCAVADADRFIKKSMQLIGEGKYL